MHMKVGSVKPPSAVGEEALVERDRLRPAVGGDVATNLGQRTGELALSVVRGVGRGQTGEGVEDVHRDAELVAGVARGSRC